jgi:hypothetical protein
MLSEKVNREYLLPPPILIIGLTLLLVLSPGMKLTAAINSTPRTIVIPTPKEEHYSNGVIVIAEKGQAKVAIVHDKNSVIATELADIIKQKNGAVVTVMRNNGINSSVLIIMDIGGKHPAVSDLNVSIPKKMEGYAIKSGKWRKKTVVVIAGYDKSGLYWGVQTLRQLLSSDAGKLTLPQCSIRDWPDFSYRSMGGQDSLQAIKENLRYKIKINFLPPWERDIRGYWDVPKASYLRRLTNSINYTLPRGGLVNQWVEPYDAGQGDKPSQHNITCSRETDLQAYYNTFKKGLALGNRLITIGIDDHAANPKHLNEQDKGKFGSPAATHAYLVSWIANRVKRDFPGTMICVVPGNYHGAEDIKSYYDKAGVPEDVVIMWTGVKTISFEFTPKEVARLVAGLEGRRFVVFDNTFAQPLGKQRGPVLFEKYAVAYKPLTASNKSLGIHVMGVMNRNVRFTIKGMQVADFLWNAKNYNPERSRRRVLTKVAGAAAVEPLLAFRKTILKVAKDFPIEKSVSQLKKIGYLKSFVVSDELYRNCQMCLNKTGAILKQIKLQCKNRKLVAELQQLQNNARSMVEYYYQKSRKSKIIVPQGNVIFEFPTDIVGGTYFRNYAWKCPKRSGVTIYGRGKPGGAKAFIKFKLDRLPTKQATLKIEGQACKGTPFIIRFNGVTLLKGRDIFPYGNWKTVTMIIKQNLFKSGQNTIEFETDTPGKAWVMPAKVELFF